MDPIDITQKTLEASSLPQGTQTEEYLIKQLVRLDLVP
jgi:hypothetical protein